MRHLSPVRLGAVLLALLALTITARAAEMPPPAARSCLECHSLPGLREHPQAPLLHGQDKRYLTHQITAFQRGLVPGQGGFARLDRKHPVMSGKAKQLDSKDMDAVAGWFSAHACLSARTIDAAPETPRPPDALVSRCLFCHGQGGRNQHAYVPNLAGQRRAYLENQLRSFRDTTWRDAVGPEASRHHSMMSRQGAYLTDADIGVLAGYFAGLPCR